MALSLTIAFYVAVVTSSMVLTTACFELIREPSSFKNIIGLVFLTQIAIVDYLAIKQFNKFINKLKQIRNEKSD